VTSQANDAAVLGPRPALHPQLAVHSLPPSRWVRHQESAASSAAAVKFGIHGPPLFLKVRSLRL